MLERLPKLSNTLAKMYEIAFYHQPLARYVQRSVSNLFECEKVFQLVHIAPPTEQSIKSSTFIFQTFCLNFKSFFTILKELMNDFWTALRVFKSMFYVVIGFTNKANKKVAASNINIKIHKMFSEQRILGVCMTNVQRKISVDLTRTCF